MTPSTRRRRTRRIRAVPAALLAATALSVTACASDPVTPPLAQAVSYDAAVNEDVYDVRYCELLVVDRERGGDLLVDVYNTLGLNDCPQEDWDDLDAEALADDLGAVTVDTNGPRYWLIDHFKNSSRIDDTPRQLGTTTMSLAGQLSLERGEEASETYVPRTVARNTVFVFRGGAAVHILTDPDGEEYWMQSYSQQIEPEQDLASLESLGDRLDLPEGWTYTTRLLAEDSTLEAVDDTAYVIADELGNTYQRQEAAV